MEHAINFPESRFNPAVVNVVGDPKLPGELVDLRLQRRHLGLEFG
jgi:hypothetical protein